MDYGFAVSDYNAYMGTYGFLIKVDVSAYLPSTIAWVQGENGELVKSEVATAGVTQSTLQGYLEDTSPPDIAWSYNSEVLTIFFKHDTYDTRFAFGGTRKCQKVVSDTDLMDVPEYLLELVSLYAIAYAWTMKKNRVDPDIQGKIEEAEYDLRNE